MLSRTRARWAALMWGVEARNDAGGGEAAVGGGGGVTKGEMPE